MAHHGPKEFDSGYGRRPSFFQVPKKQHDVPEPTECPGIDKRAEMYVKWFGRGIAYADDVISEPNVQKQAEKYVKLWGRGISCADEVISEQDQKEKKQYHGPKPADKAERRTMGPGSLLAIERETFEIIDMPDGRKGVPPPKEQQSAPQPVEYVYHRPVLMGYYASKWPYKRKLNSGTEGCQPDCNLFV